LNLAARHVLGGDKATCSLLDKRSRNGVDIEDTKRITTEEAEFLLREPVTTTIKRAKNCPDCAA
jgi:hypothetical protein